MPVFTTSRERHRLADALPSNETKALCRDSPFEQIARWAARQLALDLGRDLAQHSAAFCAAEPDLLQTSVDDPIKLSVPLVLILL